jgi:hypothetical protein
MTVNIEASDFVSRFMSVAESSSMYFSNSIEYAQMLALMLKEEDIANKLQALKDNVSPEIGIELYIVESDVVNSIHPDQKIKYKFKDGKTKVFTVDLLRKALKKVRMECFSYVSALVVEHNIGFVDVKLHMPSRQLGSLKTDNKKVNQRFI